MQNVDEGWQIVFQLLPPPQNHSTPFTSPIDGEFEFRDSIELSVDECNLNEENKKSFELEVKMFFQKKKIEIIIYE